MCAHDTAKVNESPLSIFDDDVIAGQRVGFAVQRREPFAFFGSAEDHGGMVWFVGNCVKVKGVSRLAVCAHEKVCTINNIVKASYSGGLEFLLEPIRGWFNCDIFKYNGCPAGVENWIGFDSQSFAHRRFNLFS